MHGKLWNMQMDTTSYHWAFILLLIIVFEWFTMTTPLFLVQSFFETVHYCDEWRKFTSVSQSVSQLVIVLTFRGGVLYVYDLCL
jgi:hypothetical protein